MSERRETIKKTLGISEYPWSSEDEEVTSVPAQPSSSSLSDLSMMHRLMRQPQSASQPGPSTSTPNIAPREAGQPQGAGSVAASVAAVAAAATSAAARNAQASRADRNFFWSILCNSNRGEVRVLSSSPQATTSAESPRLDPARAAAAALRRQDTLLRRSSPLHEIRGILAIKKAAAKRLNHNRASLSLPNFSTALHNTGYPRNGGQSRSSKIPLYSPASLEANLRSSRIRRAVNERIARSHEQAIPSTSGLGRTAALALRAPPPPPPPPTPRILPVYHTAPSPSRAGDHVHQEQGPYGDHVDGDEAARSPGDDSDVEISNPRKQANDRAGSTFTAGADLTLQDMDVEVLDVTAAEPGEGTSNRQEGAEPKSVDAQTTTTSTEEARGVKRKKESKDDTEKELNQSLLRLLECPVCLEWMQPPMSQCRRGHLVCVACRSRLSACPVCRTAFSSVRNRAMEGVAEILRYPCRHGCGREVRLRRRGAHEASCAFRRYLCPAPACPRRALLPLGQLPAHFQSKHPTMLRVGHNQKFTVKLNAEQHDNWFILAMREMFHLRIDVDIRTWGVTIYASYIGPKNNAKGYTYEVTVVGNYNSRQFVYSRATHSDLESASVNVSRQDCFHLSLDQALNYLRGKNRICESDNSLTISVALSKNEVEVDRDESGDS